MSLPRKVLREPMVHFLIIGAAIFALSARFGDDPGVAGRDRIVVTDGRLQQITRIFSETWQRSPTEAELDGLVESYVREEIYYREAVKLGLDRDDTVIRRRMQQKMEFLTEPAVDVLTPTDADLEEFLAAHRDAFRTEPEFAFQHIFINPSRPGAPAAERAEALLAAARTAPADAGPDDLGDPTLLPQVNGLTPADIIDQSFGEGFGASLADLPVDAWSGPVESAYGLHLLRVTSRRDGGDPPLAEIRPVVELKWREAMRDEFREQAYLTLRENYEVVLPGAASAAEPGR